MADNTNKIPPRSGVAFYLNKDQRLRVIDPEGVQVADLVAFSRADPKEVISNGRSIDYEGTIYLTKGNRVFSNRSNVMLNIVGDTCGRHDFLLTPCSEATFRLIHGSKDPHRGCFGNLVHALEPHGIEPDQIPCAFNCFMNVDVERTGKVDVLPPTSKSGDYIEFEAQMDLIIGLTACSSPLSNGGSCKPIHYSIS